MPVSNTSDDSSVSDNTITVIHSNFLSLGLMTIVSFESYLCYQLQTMMYEI